MDDLPVLDLQVCCDDAWLYAVNQSQQGACR